MSSDRRADEDAIRQLVDRQVKGWDAGNPEAYAGVFTPTRTTSLSWVATTRAAKRSQHRMSRCSRNS
jgi:uncharacterized protein (TIGR02246 family)